MVAGTTRPYSRSAMLEPLNEAQLNWKQDEESWSIRQVVEHLYNADNMAFAGRIAYIMENDGAAMPAITPEDRAAGTSALRVSVWLELLALFRERRLQNCARARAFDPDPLAHTVTYQDYGAFAAWDFLLEWPYHDLSHLAQIGDIIKAQNRPWLQRNHGQGIGGNVRQCYLWTTLGGFPLSMTPKRVTAATE